MHLYADLERIMKKQPDTYLEVDPWKLVEKGFHSDRSRVSESLFSQSNEYLGIRGFFEEGYGGDRLPGLYLNGLFEEKLEENSSYKGISNRLSFMVNTVDWLYFRFSIDGEILDLSQSAFDDFCRFLDFRTGELIREFLWKTESGRETHCRFARIVSMTEKEITWQSVSFTPLNWSGEIECTTGIDHSLEHEAYEKNYWVKTGSSFDGSKASFKGKTVNTGFHLQASYDLKLPEECSSPFRFEENAVLGHHFVLPVKKGEESHLEKVTRILFARGNAPVRDGDSLSPVHLSYSDALEGNRLYWKKIWDLSDIEIGGDPINQQGIRFCIFQLAQTYSGNSKGANIGAKGLTGEAYNGNAFWDTETYCLPFYLFNNRTAARSLLEYRYNTLEQAKHRAADLDCRGACYPVATLDGTESCTLWQHASLQFQPSTAVVFAVQHYMNMTDDRSFLLDMGLEIVLEVCRFLASRVQWSPGKEQYGFYGVMGPDEFQVMVNNNCYTNYMAVRSFEYGLELLETIKISDPEALRSVKEKILLKDSEVEQWKNMAEKMFVPYDGETQLFEQHEGFFDLPHIEIGDIPIEDFPLYHSWAYDRIYRNDMIKQPDVLMFMLLYNQSFTRAQKVANYDYYEPRCIHESSLSPSVHSILALELEKYDEALDFFRFATRIDLDNYNRNTREGLHMTAIAAAWMNIVYGFAGFRSDGPIPVLDPVLPESWTSLKLNLRIGGSLLLISISPMTTEVRVSEGEPVEIVLRGAKTLIDSRGTVLSTRIAQGREVPA